MTDIQLNEIISYLQQKGYDCTVIGNAAGDIFVDVIIHRKKVRLKCRFPKSFPYDFPKIYILEEFNKDIVPLPHIVENGYICTFDSNVAFPNFHNPKDVVYESVKKAIKIIEEGINGENRQDFIEEFTSYWEMETQINTNIWALFTPDNHPRMLYYYNDNEYNIYASDDLSQLEEYLKSAKNLFLDIKSQVEKCLYLPLQKAWYPPYPKTDKEIYLKVSEDEESFKVYYRYLKNRNEMSLVIFSQEVRGERYLAGWIHKPVRTRKGFRKGKILPELAYLVENKDRQIIKLNVSRIDRRRLFNRGGDGNIVSDYKVSITGCGSIGSYLVQVLAELGIDDFSLIDKDMITPENIARHMCGASEIGKLKSESIKEHLIKHYPYIKCKSLPKDVFEVFDSDIEVFNNCDINFVVVGHKPTEARIVEMFNQGKISKPIVLIWVEPFLLGGHAIILQNQQDIESIIYDEEYKFKYSVVSEGGKYTKREAGCQSTYIPYSAFEAKQFIYSFADYFYSDHILKRKKGNYLFSWCGNLKWARKENVMISDYWLSKENRTINLQRLDSNE